jgi:hypothetical protein
LSLSGVSVGKENELSQLEADLTAARAGYYVALAEVDKYTAKSRALPPGHPDGATALRLANQSLKDATERYNAALKAHTEYRTRSQRPSPDGTS